MIWKLPNLILDFGIDGLPLFKSSTTQIWPILTSVSCPTYIGLVGVYEGNSKPHCALNFLEEFIAELQILLREGFLFSNKCFQIIIRCIAMDAPAKSFVLGTKRHSGYFSCVRCTQKGLMVKHRLVFPPGSDA